MTLSLSRRAWLMAATGLALSTTRRATAALRIPSGAELKLPLPAPRRAVDPARATEWSDVWPLALTHESLATALIDGGFAWPLLAGPPAIDRADARVATLSLRPAMTFSNGAPVTASGVLDAWRAARASPLGRLALSRLDTMNPFEARGDLDLTLRLAVAGTLDETLAAWPLALCAPGSLASPRAGIGPFMARGNDASSLVRNPRCPTGPAFLERVSLEPARSRNDELRAFTTGALDASWWGNSLYEVTRPADALRGRASIVVGIVPTLGGVLASASAARTLERVLAPLSAGEAPLLGALGVQPELSSGAAPDVPTLTRALQGREVRVAREASDGSLNVIAERVVALLDAVQVRVSLVNAGDPCDATLRAVAPLGSDPSVALASLLAAAAAAGGDEAGASAIVRTPSEARARIAAGVWGRNAVAVLGLASPVLHVRSGVRDARFDAAGRVLLGDAWVGAG
jgi:hypothetical protein